MHGIKLAWLCRSTEDRKEHLVDSSRGIFPQGQLAYQSVLLTGFENHLLHVGIVRQKQRVANIRDDRFRKYLRHPIAKIPDACMILVGSLKKRDL